MHRKVLYVGNYLNPSFGPFSLVGCSITGFLRFLCIEDVAYLNCHPFSPFFSHFSPFSPGLLHILCCRWMVDYDDGESPDVLYIHNATNWQLDCDTLLSRLSNLHGHCIAISRLQCPSLYELALEPRIRALRSSPINSMAYQ